MASSPRATPEWPQISPPVSARRLHRRLLLQGAPFGNELDGGQHNERTGAIRDKFRTELIGERGYRILRFWDNEVLTNIDGVLQIIMDAIERSELNKKFDLSLALSLDKERGKNC